MIVNEEGDEVGIGVVGDLVLKGPGLMTKYYKDDVATSHTMVDGWLYTGDMAYKNAIANSVHRSIIAEICPIVKRISCIFCASALVVLTLWREFFSYSLIKSGFVVLTKSHAS